ncbi:MAG: HD domain-containing protein [Acholeplasmataceae bacterium]
MKQAIGKVISINRGDNFANTSIYLEGNVHFNVKLNVGDEKKLEIGKVYVFELEPYKREEDTNYKAISFSLLEKSNLDKNEKDRLLNIFYDHAPISLTKIKEEIENYLNKIENKILKDITNYVYLKYKAEFYLHPAATKFHHAYVGGLSYHTYTMLKIAENMLEIYPFLNKDLLYSGTILHDVSKVNEMTGVDGEYTKEGMLIGHLVMGAIEVEEAALKLNVSDSEEALLLKHLIISHHGLLNFGSPKKPQIGEALMLWYIDTIDSKFTELGENLKRLKDGEFTESIGVLDRMRFYKPKLKK